MVVNGANVSHHSNPSEIKTFLGEINIKRRRMELTVTPTKITLMGETIDWTNGMTCIFNTSFVNHIEMSI
jgi:hypothetical protein